MLGRQAMKYERDRLVLDPSGLALLWAAFDAAWDECEQDYEGSRTSIEVGRLRLANAVLAAYQSGVRNPPMIRAAALRRMAMWHRQSEAALLSVGVT
jgi:hypothetical protein